MGTETLPDTVLEAAAAWHERLHQEGVSEEIGSAFAAWLAQSAECRLAYDSVSQVWTQLQNAASDPRVLALRHETALRLTRRASAASRPLRWAVAAVLLTVLFGTAATLGGWIHSNRFLVRSLHDSAPTQDTTRYSTATGERLAITLTDGSQVTLDTHSELKIAFTPSERVVQLLKGQIYLKVAKNRERPFVVEVLDRRIVAVGTAFDVRLDGSRLHLAMVEGTVRVEHRGESVDTPNLTAGAPASAEMVTAGQQLIADGVLPDRIGMSDTERSTNWLRGQVVFDDTRLADAVAELNRYSNTQMQLADPGIGELHLSGAFATGRPALFIEAVTSYFPVKVVRTDDNLVVLGAKR